MRDAAGARLAAPLRRTIVVGPPLRAALDPADWRVTPPRKADEPLVIDFPHALDAALALRAFTVTLEGLASFGGDRPRAIVAKAQAAQPLIELHSDHERIMQRIGMAPEPRKYTPHITLARLKTASPMAVADYLSTRGFFFSRRFEATRFVLFSSRDSVGGGPYVIEAAFPLE